MTGLRLTLRRRFLTSWYKLKHQYVLHNVSFGRGTTVECRLSIQGPGRVSIGADCRLGSDPWGGDFVSIHTHQPEAVVSIGDGVVLRATRFGCHRSIRIDEGAVVECASIFDSDFHTVDAAGRDDDSQAKNREVVIGAGSYVGCECICSKGTRIGRGAVLLPVSVIGTKSIPENAVAGGNPTMLLRRGETQPEASTDRDAGPRG
jgi:carbonic anhydrase/acetyltransferase-like protein (isoleucine patch superfamily)